MAAPVRPDVAGSSARRGSAARPWFLRWLPGKATPYLIDNRLIGKVLSEIPSITVNITIIADIIETGLAIKEDVPAGKHYLLFREPASPHYSSLLMFSGPALRSCRRRPVEGGRKIFGAPLACQVRLEPEWF